MICVSLCLGPGAGSVIVLALGSWGLMAEQGRTAQLGVRCEAIPGLSLGRHRYPNDAHAICPIDKPAPASNGDIAPGSYVKKL